MRALIHGVSRKDPTRMAAKTIDNVTVHFPLVESVPDLAAPWVDVRVERAAVWGVAGIATGRAARWDGPAQPLAPRVVDLLTLAVR